MLAAVIVARARYAFVTRTVARAAQAGIALALRVAAKHAALSNR